VAKSESEPQSVCYRSRVNRAPGAALDMQTSIMPPSRSEIVRSVSRWSTSPSSTRARHGPQNPCWHEYGVVTFARRNPDRRVSSAPTRTVAPDDATVTSNSLPVQHRGSSEPFEVQLDVAAAGQLGADRGQHRSPAMNWNRRAGAVTGHRQRKGIARTAGGHRRPDGGGLCLPVLSLSADPAT
jgi:hypothetical protein